MNQFSWVARIGYAGRGALFLTTGSLALYWALRAGSGKPKGAIDTMLEQPMGEFILGVLGVAFLSFAAWRILQAFGDADELGRDREALLQRAGYALGALPYGALALWSLHLSLTRSLPPNAETIGRRWAAWLLDVPLGAWILGALGAGLLATAGGIALRALRRPLDPKLRMKRTMRTWLRPLTRYGLVVRALMFALMGGSLILAAVGLDARATKGVGGIFQELLRQPYGSVALALIAIGFLSYGLHEAAQAIWHRPMSRSR